jgi:hypothetical protein
MDQKRDDVKVSKLSKARHFSFLKAQTSKMREILADWQEHQEKLPCTVDIGDIVM